MSIELFDYRTNRTNQDIFSVKFDYCSTRFGNRTTIVRLSSIEFDVSINKIGSIRFGWHRLVIKITDQSKKIENQWQSIWKDTKLIPWTSWLSFFSSSSSTRTFFCLLIRRLFLFNLFLLCYFISFRIAFDWILVFFRLFDWRCRTFEIVIYEKDGWSNV